MITLLPSFPPGTEWVEIDMDDGWFEAHTPEEFTAPITAPIRMPAQRCIGVLPCAQRSTCAACGRPMFAGEPVRPAHNTVAMPYECLSCWWATELWSVRAAV